jgi:hypothetical protein
MGMWRILTGRWGGIYHFAFFFLKMRVSWCVCFVGYGTVKPWVEVRRGDSRQLLICIGRYLIAFGSYSEDGKNCL